LLLVALAAFTGLSLTGPSAAWWNALLGRPTGDLIPADPAGGLVGAQLSLALRVIFGAAWCWLVPVLLLLVGAGNLLRRTGWLRGLLQRAAPLWLASTAWIAQPQTLLEPGPAAAWGGVCGVWLGRGFHLLFGLWGGRIFLSFLLLVSLTVILKPWLRPVGERIAPGWRLVRSVGRRGLGLLRELAAWPGWLIRRGSESWRAWTARRRQEPAPESETVTTAAAVFAERRRVHGATAEPAPAEPVAPEPAGSLDFTAREAPQTPVAEVPVVPARPAARAPAGGGQKKRPRPGQRSAAPGEIKLPPLSLLRDPDTEVQPITPAALDLAADLLEDTLRSFGVEGEVKDVRPGPVVTTFEYQPAAGIKVSQIVQRADDLALAMKARTIRMEAPIPGKAAVGIEIPNPSMQIVRLKEVLTLAAGALRTPLTVVLGKDVVGQAVAIDIGTLPHLLVAGSTGSGKSVCLNSMICNLLLRNEPSRMRLVLIDPKMLEMSVYNGIPHLLLPVVTDPKEALRALKWMVAQMELRYRQLARAGVRNIDAYNLKVERGEAVGLDGEPATETMPYYLTIVDELADLMIQLGQEFELPVTRLAQKARAVGIHLILATQRPSVDVLTGVIKANIPCRIAFRVIQKNDSRTILDMNGAEQLLGSGDMLYLQPGRALPVRVHGSFIEVEECEAIVEHWRQYDTATEMISLSEDLGGEGVYTGEDDLFEEAKRIVVLHQSGSTSLLQRRLRVGYTRAGRLIDMLEEAGVVGPFTGSKAREVLLKPEELPDYDGPEAGGAEA